MANRLLLQSIVKFRDQIKDGSAKVFDIVQDYFNKTGKTVTEEERALILNEFAKDAPSNVQPLKSRVFDEVDETMEGFDPDYMRGTEETDITAGELKKRGPNVQKVGEMSDTPVTDKIMKDRDVELRGDESFGEILEKFKTKEEGLGSLFPKGEPGSIFDQKNTNREEVAEFIRKMRGAGIKNEDIQKVIKEETFFETQPAYRGNPDAPKEVVNLGQGKRAATTLARAADMKADTKVKQELLSELDEMKMDNSPRFFQEEYMGYDDFISAVEAKKIEVNNAIVDDLEAMGVPDEKISDIMGIARRQRDSNFYTSGEEFVDVIKEELDFNDIKYDVEFYKNYFKELESLLRKPEPRFAYGGMI